MIHFFRRIRQGLINKERAGKYLLYAVGEILLVMIGILLALQVNNWNDARNQNIKLKVLKGNLLNEVQTHLEDFEFYIEKARIQVDGISALMKMMGRPIDNENRAALDSLIYLSLRDYQPSLSLNQLKEAKNIGSIGLIKNDSLRNALNDLIYLDSETQKRISMINDDNNNAFLPFYYRNLNLRNLMMRNIGDFNLKVGLSQIEEFDYNQILRNMEFESLLTMRLYYAQSMLIMRQNVKEYLEYVEKLLKEE